MELSVVIPTKDREEIFDETLRAAAAAIAGLSAEIVVVNDSKTKQPLIPASFHQVRLINNPKMGVASARNLGARESSGRIILFLDNDILISSHSISHLLRQHRELGHAALNLDWTYPQETIKQLYNTAFGRFLITHSMTTFRGWYGDAGWRMNECFESLSVASFHLSLLREDFNRTGGYDEKFPHAGFEDFDFPLRLKKAGVQFYIDTRETVYHNEEDRTQIEPWLDSQERRASTRAVAVQQGYSSLTLTYHPVKKIILSLLLGLSPMIVSLLKILPNVRILDPLFFSAVSAMQAAKIYKGYSAGLKV